MPAAERALLLVPDTLAGLAALLGLAEPLASGSVPHELIVAAVVEPAELGAATAVLAVRRNELLGRGLGARTAAFSLTEPRRGPGAARGRLSAIELALLGAGAEPLEGATGVVLEQADCHVALLAEAGGARRQGPVIVPFGGGWHDWTALELGAWVARATESPLRLIGAASDGREEARCEPPARGCLTDRSATDRGGRRAAAGQAGPKRVMALSEGAGLLVVGLGALARRGPRTARSALLEAPPAPLVLVRRGERSAGAAPPADRTPLRLVADGGGVVIAAIGPGTTFGAYRVEGVVGRGGMGVVYRATDLSLARPVALKLIAPELAGDERFRARFLREPRLAASLDHPSVVPIYEAGERDGQLCLVMRFVEGSDLKTVLEREGTLSRSARSRS